jgi:hypothetical protein
MQIANPAGARHCELEWPVRRMAVRFPGTASLRGLATDATTLSWFAVFCTGAEKLRFVEYANSMKWHVTCLNRGDLTAVAIHAFRCVGKSFLLSAAGQGQDDSKRC